MENMNIIALFVCILMIFSSPKDIQCREIPPVDPPSSDHCPQRNEKICPYDICSIFEHDTSPIFNQEEADIEHCETDNDCTCPKICCKRFPSCQYTCVEGILQEKFGLPIPFGS
ncbi:uncharacterized protein LOC143228947 [Tachypleus tridentatus]|uniref:uncharacterized protein LOC143228947 n=1 Tax=Tachypleus tridentatus TaxID=6853 RepID=UPI003FD237DC